MREKPNRDERIVEAIESCRPDSGDVSEPALRWLADALAADPELEQVYRRVQACDARLAAAFHDVEVPEGLASRILAGVATAAALKASGLENTAEQEKTPTEAATTAINDADEPAVGALLPIRAGRRRWLAAAAVLAGLAASVAVMLFEFGRAAPMSQEQMLGRAIDYFNREPELPGTLLTDDNEPADYPLGGAIYRFPGIRYRKVERFLDREAMAYDITSRWGVRATLYVVRASGIDVTGLPPAPPANAAFRTLGCSSAAWYSGGLVYVLVVGGDSKRAYDSFLPPPGSVT